MAQAASTIITRDTALNSYHLACMAKDTRALQSIAHDLARVLMAEMRKPATAVPAPPIKAPRKPAASPRR